MKTILTVLFLLVNQLGYSQFIACEDAWAEHFEVTAKSGLKLRASPDAGSKVIALIPFKTEVRLCYDHSKRDTFEGIGGNWVKAYWGDKEGFVFDGFVEKKKEASKIDVFRSSIDLVSDWNDTGMGRDKDLVGLYATSHPFTFEFRKVVLTPKEVPLWVFRGLDYKESRKIKGTVVDRVLLIGDKVPIRSGEFGGTVYGDGSAIKGDSSMLAVFSEINPYQLRIRTRTENGAIVDQLLLQMKLWSGDGAFQGYEGRVEVNFIGDLDGDNKDDVLVTYQQTYKGWAYGLFSTKQAIAPKVFKEMTIGSGSE